LIQRTLVLPFRPGKTMPILYVFKENVLTLFCVNLHALYGSSLPTMYYFILWTPPSSPPWAVSKLKSCKSFTQHFLWDFLHDDYLPSFMSLWPGTMILGVHTG
jgi:hypothetical protein